MSILPTRMGGFEDGEQPVIVIAAFDEDSIVAAGLLAIGLRSTHHSTRIEVDGDIDRDWTNALRQWCEALPAPISVRVAGGSEAAAGRCVIADGPRLLSINAPQRQRLQQVLSHDEGAIAAVVGFGTEGASDAERHALAAAAANGELLGVEALLRYELAGRLFIELVEHLHHSVGPERQSRLADVIRASLFGRVGRHPVNLTSQADPPLVGPEALLVWYLEVAGCLQSSPTT